MCAVKRSRLRPRLFVSPLSLLRTRRAARYRLSRLDRSAWRSCMSICPSVLSRCARAVTCGLSVAAMLAQVGGLPVAAWLVYPWPSPRPLCPWRLAWPGRRGLLGNTGYISAGGLYPLVPSSPGMVGLPPPSAVDLLWYCDWLARSTWTAPPLLGTAAPSVTGEAMTEKVSVTAATSDIASSGKVTSATGKATTTSVTRTSRWCCGTKGPPRWEFEFRRK